MTTLRELTLTALSSCNLREKGQGHYRGNSPLRPGADGGNFDVRFTDADNGVWYDHKEATGGHVIDLLKRLNVAIPDELQFHSDNVHGTKRPYTSAKDYAAAHGLSMEQLSAAGWCEDVHGGRPALRFITATGSRWRFLDGKTPTYINEPGYAPCWYGLKKAPALAKVSGLPLVLVNGEISTVSAQAVGIPAACVTSGEKRIPDHLVQELRTMWQGDIVIAFDCDDAGRKASAAVKAQLPKARIFDLKNGDGGDMADFATLYHDDAVNELHKRLTTESEPPPMSVAAATDDHIAALNNHLRDLRLAVAATDPNKEAVLTDEARKLLDKIEQRRAAASVVNGGPIIEILEKNIAAVEADPVSIRGMVTYIDPLDAVIGGFRGGNMYTFMAETGMGKTTLMATFADALVCQGRGLIVATELSEAAFMLKMLASRAGVTAQMLEDGQDSHGNLLRTHARREHVYDAIAEYSMLAQRISYLVASRATPKQVHKAMQEAADTGKAVDWVLVDSMSNLRAPGDGIYERTTAASNALQGIAQLFNIPVLATAQIGRNTKARADKTPTLMDALGSGAIEQDASGLFGLYWHHYYERQGAEALPEVTQDKAWLVCLKHRWRGSAAGARVDLKYRPGCRFEEWRTSSYDDYAALAELESKK